MARTHNPKAPGSNPGPATIRGREGSGISPGPSFTVRANRVLTDQAQRPATREAVTDIEDEKLQKG